jgi:hypothetical protein
MFSLIATGHGLLALDDLPKRLKMNSQYIRDVVLEEAGRAVIAITKESGIEERMIHMNNCKVHNYAKVRNRLEEFQVTQLAHPAYSLDISPPQAASLRSPGRLPRVARRREQLASVPRHCACDS